MIPAGDIGGTNVRLAGFVEQSGRLEMVALVGDAASFAPALAASATGRKFPAASPINIRRQI